MNSKLDDAVIAALADITAAAPPPESTPTPHRPARDVPVVRRHYVAIAASVLVLGGVGALLGLTNVAAPSKPATTGASVPPNDSPSVTIPSTTPAPVLTPEVPISSPVPADDELGNPDSPVRVTGQRIGDVPFDEPPTWLRDGEIDAEALPPWATVASAGRIIGYVRPFDVLLGESDQITIFDEDGRAIGTFVDGKPVIDRERLGE